MQFNGAKLKGHSGHAVDDTCFFVLADGSRTGMPHFEQPGRAIAAHAGENDADGVASRKLGDRIEQHIN